jgi:predicted hydrocarbon binding protein
MDLSDKDIIDFSQYAFTRMDGAWFLAVAKKFGIDAAWEMDVEAWKQLSYLYGKKLRKERISDPVWPDSFIDALDLFSKIIRIDGREVSVDSDTITVRVTDCETQKAIAKAGIADCGIVTVETYMGIARGLYGEQVSLDVAHTKNLNRGDDCCEVVIRRRS